MARTVKKTIRVKSPPKKADDKLSKRPSSPGRAANIGGAGAHVPGPHVHGPGCGHDHTQKAHTLKAHPQKELADTSAVASGAHASPAAQVVDKLKGGGFRLTKLRRLLIELIASARGPLSVGDIRTALLSAKLAPNKSTLYRELYFLMEQKVVAEVDFLDGMKRYEFIAHDGHHHHIICTKCKVAECVEICFDTAALLSDLAKHSDFLVQNHVLEFFGLCGKCR
jgi:Fur family ferric uptake transcriptional regulator